ncbi:MAG TPA: EAL domain-containing protein [Kineosporiaceae bacterium]|nr:EAL domain-containing protein [Kineosporiaceae bacterium]
MSSATAAVPPVGATAASTAPTPAPVEARPAISGAASTPVSTAEGARRVQQEAVRQIVAEGGPQIVYQPQLSLSRLVVDGYEALARFPDSPIRGTESWFARARELNLGAALEASALHRALSRRHERPAGTILAVNLSPAVLASPAVAAVLPDDLTGIEIELTEHEWAPGGGRLRRQLDLLRERGARVAIDDVGVAHSGLRRVMDLAPDRIKLDKHLVQGVAGSHAKTALIRAVVDFAEHINAAVVAEGVENLDDLEALAELDVGYAQGWMIGLPESDFQGADPLAIASGRDSLARMLVGRQRRTTRSRVLRHAPGSHDPAGDSSPSPPDSAATSGATGSAGASSGKPGAAPTAAAYDATADVEELLVQLTRVTSLAELGALAGTCAGVLGGDSLQISVLTDDGSAIQSLRSPITGGAGEVFTLADYPITRRCLETRAVIPIYLDSDGDPSEWQVLARLGFQAALLVPVISRDRVIGLLECYRRCPSPWSRRQIRSARTVAAMLGPVLDVTLQIELKAP